MLGGGTLKPLCPVCFQGKPFLYLEPPTSMLLYWRPWPAIGAPCRPTSHLSVTPRADRALIHVHSWIFNLLLLQGYKRHIYTQEREGAAYLSFCSLSSCILSLPPSLLSTSLNMYNLNISSNMQTLISHAHFIRGVDQETFFPWHFEGANTILHRLRERKIPFVLCQHKHFNLRLSLLSKQQISSEARRDTGNACGSFKFPRPPLISKSTPHSAWPSMFYQSAGHA